MKNTTFILFGATGDLAKRKIFPALYNLFKNNLIPENFSVVGLGRRDMPDEDFQKNVENSLKEFSRTDVLITEDFKNFLSNFHYKSLNIDKKEDYDDLLTLVSNLEEDDKNRNRLFYFSVAPEFFKTIAQNIEKSGLSKTTGEKKLVIEKPFGHDLASAIDLNNSLSKAFQEEEIYRIDHYLGKNMVQKLRTLTSKNPLLANLWNKNSISNIQITALESVGVEERAGYYDHTGALLDMFQNHLLQVLSIVAIENDENASVREEKKNVLQSLKKYQGNDFDAHFVFGQYGKGIIKDEFISSYLNEPGVSENSTTETFLAARLFIDNEKWRDVPFYLRTGKRASDKITKIVIEFKKNKKNDVPNYLEIEINPNEKITLFLQDEGEKEILLSDTLLNEHSKEAYEKLIYGALTGDSTYFAHWDEVRLSWEFVQPLLDIRKNKKGTVSLYPAGTDGPIESNKLLLEKGHVWL